MLPGSRGGEVRRLLPVFGETLSCCSAMVGPFRVAVPTVATVARRRDGGCARLAGPADRAASAAPRNTTPLPPADAALAASGTVALELALARRADGGRLSHQPADPALLDRVVKVRQVNLINLMLGREVVPEFLFGACAPAPLAAALAELIGDERVRSAHLAGYDEAMAMLRAVGTSPSRAAADRILAILAARRQDRPHITPSTTKEGAVA